MKEENRRDMVEHEIAKAKRYSSEFLTLQHLGYWENLANRLYYAAFHAVAALLIHDGHPVGTHRGAVTAFGKYYITTNLFTQEEGRLYSRLQSLREDSDYNCFFEGNPEVIEPKIEPTKKLIEHIENYINNSPTSLPPQQPMT